MPAQYPFIDVAVHDLIRPRLARGEALVLFAPGLERVLWCNGAGARFFGAASIYDFLEEGPVRSDITFRQIETAARQLSAIGDSRSLMLRVTSGFQKIPVTATADSIEIRKGEPVILLAVPALKRANGDMRELAQELLSGFDDPDTHMAVLDGEGSLVASSEGFSGLGMTPQTARMLINLVEADADRLVKRPIPTGRGYLPAAIGKISDAPALHLLFAVETILGQMDPSDDFSEDEQDDLPVAAAVAVAEPVRSDETLADETETETETADVDLLAQDPVIESAEVLSPVAPFDSVIAAIGDIEEIEPETDALDEGDEAQSSEAEEAEGDEAEGAELEFTETAAEGDDALADETAIASLQTTEIADEEPVSVGAESPADAPAADVADVVPPTPATVSAETVSDAEHFSFRQDRRATRFVWKIDAEGRFSEVSQEFAQAVGPRAADIQGVAFSDLAALFNLDPEGKIGELLKKRDTWSGKTIYWPVQGTRLVVPVDLAALPTYTRNREFDGFRGFGIVRVADAQEDPDSIGMTFVRQEPTLDAPDELLTGDHSDRDEELQEFLSELSEGESHPPEDFVEDQIAEAGEQTLDALHDESGDDAHDETGQDEETETAGDLPPVRPIGFEPPVLRIMEPRKPSQPDKVVQLQDHRARQRDSLTPGEQAAFQEIARKLDPLSLRARVEQSLTPSEPPVLRTEPVAPAPKAAEPPQAPPASPIAATEPPAPVAEPPTEPALPDLPADRPLGKRERSLTADIID
nr:PAS domain-containing sensor histidine kinase [Rhizobium sp.]